MRTVLVAALTAIALLVHDGPPIRRGIIRSVAVDSGSRRRRQTVALATVVAASVGVVSLARGPADVVGLVGAAAVAVAAGWLVRANRSEQTRHRRRESVIGLCDALSAELQAGLAAETALARACTDWPEFRQVGRVARVGGDIANAFGSLAGLPGYEGLRAVAAGWTVAARSGGSLAAVLERVAEGLRDEGAARAEVESALGPPRATARMLAVLPLFGLLLGSAMGAHPMSFLLGTPAGRGCLLVGVLLALAGIAWVERIAGAVRSA